jgi:hypothetical protein
MLMGPSSCTGAKEVSSWKADRAKEPEPTEERERCPRLPLDDPPKELDLVNNGLGADWRIGRGC